MEISLSKSKSLLGIFLVICMRCIVDACTIVEYEAKCKGCVNKFADSLRIAPSLNCSMKYVSLRKCISSEKNDCLKTSGITNTTAMFIRQRSMIYTASEEFFCTNGMLDSLKNYRKSSLTMCTNKLYTKTAKCRTRFRKRFLQNRGGRSICRLYYKAKQCMISGLKNNCKESRFVSQLIKNYEQVYNPYCKSRSDPVKSPTSSGRFGACTQKSYTVKSRECIKNFIHTLQRNKGLKCRATVDSKLIPCMKRRVRRCLRGTRDAKILKSDINKAFAAQRVHTQNRYCEGGFLETLPLGKGQCSEEYFETFQAKCNTRFIAKYRENKANPLLCQAYAEVKRCARNMTMTLCTLDDSMLDAVHFLYGDFNPFCYDGKDHSRAAIGTHDKQSTSAENKASISHTWSFTTLVTLMTSMILVIR